MEKHNKTETIKNSPEAYNAAVTDLASAYHEDWRKTRQNKDGTFEPRLKTTKDESWINTHGTDQIDIANTPYTDLPPDWQAENKSAAETVVSLLESVNGGIDLNDAATRTSVGDKIHNAWLDRNAWAKGSELDVAFDQLPPDEQNKDLRQVEIAVELFNQP
jgi:hypothetical protein